VFISIDPTLIAGIDYGSKLAGTTSICFETSPGVLSFRSSRKGEDADMVIADFCQKGHPSAVFIDAPLSLPGVYRHLSGCSDYFYRACDREAGAMSPMFLGGLTARAIKLASSLSAEGILVTETYPGKVAELLQLNKAEYKRGAEFIIPCTRVVMELVGRQVTVMPASWHEFDSLLAYVSAWRYGKGLHEVFGEPSEGLIIV